MESDQIKKLDPEKQVLLVAYYLSLGMSPKQIEALYGLSQATISRRLEQARKEGYLQETVIFTPGRNIDEIKHFFPNSPQEAAFEGYFKPYLLRKVIIVPNPPGEPIENESAKDPARTKEDPRVLRVGRAAAIYLANVLKDEHEVAEDKYGVGLSFGKTIRAVVQGFLNPYKINAGLPRQDILFVPLVGGLSVLPEHPESQSDVFECAASSLAVQLARIFLGDNASKSHITLPTPAFVPTSFLAKIPIAQWDARIVVARDFVKSIPEYREIFGIFDAGHRDSGALISKMKIMLTSVGPRDSGWMSTSGPVKEGERTHLLAEGVVGDIAGHFITENKVTDFGNDSIITKVNRRVFGASPLDFQQCAQRAYEQDFPGVVVVASTAHKAAAVLSAIRNRCVSTLIVDQELANAMENLEPYLRTEHQKEIRKAAKVKNH